MARDQWGPHRRRRGPVAQRNHRSQPSPRAMTAGAETMCTTRAACTWLTSPGVLADAPTRCSRAS